MEKKKDLLSGNLILNIFTFTLPIILSSILQLLFNAADLIVVGRFDLLNGSNAQAAIGTTTSLIHLIINFFLGISIGVNVIIARLYAAGDKGALRSAVQTSMLLGLAAGIIVAFAGFFFSGEILKLMNVDENIYALAADYLKIFFLGAPFIMLYNFGSAVMRAAGDTRRPMIYLTLAGVVNVILNLITVIGFHMSVIGVAIATTVSNIVSCVLIMIKLLSTDDMIKLNLKSVEIKHKWINGALAVGIPAGIQSSLFSLSNVVIQSAINSFGASATAGSGNAASIEGFIYVAMNAYSAAAVTFVSHCCGSNQKEKINKVFLSALLLVSLTGIVLGLGTYAFGEELLGIYTKNASDTAAGLERMSIISTTYFLCGIMDVTVGVVRGMGQSFIPMIISLICACGFRIVWISKLLSRYHSLTTIFISYPVSWILTILFVLVCYFIQKKKITATPKKELTI